MNWTPPKTALLLAALALSACGGGGGSDTTTKVAYTKLVSFGDSLSDVGTYKVGTIAAAGGGKFSVNSGTGLENWTELLAAQLKLSAPCAAQTGLLSNQPGIPLVAVANQPLTCTNYAQGSSRVTSPAGPNSYALQVAAGATNIGLMAVPLVTQFANHLAAHGNYTGTELVTVMAGANDTFMHINAVSSAATGGVAAAGAAAVAGWTSAEQTAVAAGGAAAVNAAATAAVAHSAQDAQELASYIVASVVGKGAKYVVVVNIPSIEHTPFGQSSGATALLKAMVSTYNTTLQNALAGRAGILYVDAYAESVAQTTNPTQYGLSNISTPACSSTAYHPTTNPTGNILGGSSLACTPLNTLAGVDVSHYLYADDVHPTPFGYQLLNRFVALKMAQAGWL